MGRLALTSNHQLSKLAHLTNPITRNCRKRRYLVGVTQATQAAKAVQAANSEYLLDGLNESQREAVCVPNTPLCIVAGAGTGKTRVLTRRIAYQSQQGNIAPNHTLALTFTRKAARELRSRLAALGMQESIGWVTAGTFHSAAYAQLQTRWAEKRQQPPHLLKQKQRLLARTAHNMGERFSSTELQQAALEIEWAKARGISPDKYPIHLASFGRATSLDSTLLSDLYERYEAEKTKRGLLDFDDLLILALRELQENPHYAEARRWRFQHLFVDEMQDVNPLQFKLLQAWLGDRNDLCAVGDPNQAIYGWNGADSGYIEHFRDWFDAATIKQLRDNYRSSPQILAVAHCVIGAGTGTLKAHCTDGPKPAVIAHADDSDEATAIAQALRAAKGPEVAWNTMAVLTRTNAQTATITAALDRAHIPYYVRTTGRGEVLNTDAQDTANEIAASANGTRAQENQPTQQPTQQTHNGDAVAVSTFHAAKGLEWPIVHLAGMEQGLVPIAHAQTKSELREERRLLYVAITRAKQQLHCHWATERRFGSKTVTRSPSPYLRSILGVDYKR